MYRLTIRGTHTAEFQGIPATGRRVTVSFLGVVRIANGKLVEEWGGLDLFDLRDQLQSRGEGQRVASACWRIATFENDSVISPSSVMRSTSAHGTIVRSKNSSSSAGRGSGVRPVAT